MSCEERCLACDDSCPGSPGYAERQWETTHQELAVAREWAKRWHKAAGVYFRFERNQAQKAVDFLVETRDRQFHRILKLESALKKAAAELDDAGKTDGFGFYACRAEEARAVLKEEG